MTGTATISKAIRVITVSSVVDTPPRTDMDALIPTVTAIPTPTPAGLTGTKPGLLIQSGKPMLSNLMHRNGTIPTKTVTGTTGPIPT